MGELVRLEVSDGVGTIRLDRPKMNALDARMQEEIRDAAEEATERDDVRAVVLYGGERVFAAGADVKEMAAMSHTEMVKRSGSLTSAIGAVARIPKPVVAAVTGYALGGGCELALVLPTSASRLESGPVIGQPEILLGIIPGAGGTQRLSRLVGPSRAKDIIFTGRFVKAEEALAIGLVDRVVPADQVYAEATAWAAQFAHAAAYALRAAKESVDRGLEVDLDTGLEIERQQFAALFATEDRTIGMQSFVEQGPGKAASWVAEPAPPPHVLSLLRRLRTWLSRLCPTGLLAGRAGARGRGVAAGARGREDDRGPGRHRGRAARRPSRAGRGRDPGGAPGPHRGGAPPRRERGRSPRRAARLRGGRAALPARGPAALGPARPPSAPRPHHGVSDPTGGPVARP